MIPARMRWVNSLKNKHFIKLNQKHLLYVISHIYTPCSNHTIIFMQSFIRLPFILKCLALCVKHILQTHTKKVIHLPFISYNWNSMSRAILLHYREKSLKMSLIFIDKYRIILKT